MRDRLCLVLVVMIFSCLSSPKMLFGQEEKNSCKKVLFAILARNKEHVLPKFLDAIDKLDYDKKLISVYINTNNNIDKTKELLTDWMNKNKSLYAGIEMDAHEVSALESDKPHEWTGVRFKVLGEIRNKSLQKTHEKNCDYYFVVDCDNFLTPCTLKELVAKDKPIIAPMLVAIPEKGDYYANYFCDIDDKGYYKDHPDYVKILSRTMKGTFKVPVVHCTYLIKTEYINKLTYQDGSDDYEFVIFSKSARKNGVDQYICNEQDFGTLVHFFTTVSFDEEKTRVTEWFNQGK